MHNTTRIPGLDALRAFAIAWTMLFHSWVVGGLGAWDALAKPGWMGVDLFFVLSGFLIGGQVFAPLAAGARFSYADFYTRRAFRILPAFLVVLALYVAWPGMREAPGMEPAWKFLAFVYNLSVDYGQHKAFSHAWSLCVEEHFYLLFPTLALLLAPRLGPRRAIALFAALVAGGMILRGLVWQLSLAPVDHMDDPVRPFATRFVEDIYYPTWNRLDGLLAGVALAAWKAWRPASWAGFVRRDGTLLVAGLAALGVALAVCRDRTGPLASIAGFPLVALGFALLVAAGSSPTSRLSRFAPPGSGWLAAVSYSLYLVHKPVFVAVSDALPATMPGPVRFVAIAIASLAAGGALHYLVERPGLRLRARLLRREARAVAVPEPA